MGTSKLCPTCHGSGSFKVYECPRKTVDDAALEVCRYAGEVYGAMMPEAGGVLDQTPTFLAALRIAKSELSAYRNPPTPKVKRG